MRKIYMHKVIFWNHSEQHSSKTVDDDYTVIKLFWNHSEQHSSKTVDDDYTVIKLFWNHSEQHSSKTRLEIFS